MPPWDIPVISKEEPDVLITLNVVPAEPFPPATCVIKLSADPEHPAADPDKDAITSAGSPKQILWSFPNEICPKIITGQNNYISNFCIKLYF